MKQRLCTALSGRGRPLPVRGEGRSSSGDDVGLIAAGEAGELGDLQRDGREGLHDLELVLAQISIGPLVLLEVEAHGGAGDARAGEPEDDPGAALEDDADALVLRDAAVNRVRVREDVVHLDLHALDLRARQGHLTHLLHHLLRLGLVDPLVVVARVVVAAVLGPVLLGHVLHTHQLAGGLALGREDLQPRQDRPHAVLLADVVRAGPERLLAADERRVLLGLREVLRVAAVHEVAEKLPARGGLEALDAFLLGDKVHGAGGGHGAGTALEAVLELGDEVRVRHDHGQGVGGGHEELGAEDHVAVGVAVRGGAEEGRWLLGRDLVAALVQAHGLHELHGIGQVGVGVAVPRRVMAAKVLPGLGVGGGAGGGAELLLDDALGVRALHTAHAVVDHAEVRHGNHLLDLLKVEALLQHREVVLHAIEDLDRLARFEGVDDRHVEAQVRHLLADLELLELPRPLHHLVGHLLRRGAAVLAVVLDAEVVVRAARVVGGRADEAAKGDEARAARADHGGRRGRGEEAVGTAPDVAHAVGEGHLDDDLDGLVVPVAAVAGDDEGAALHGDVEVLQGVEDALHIVVQVRILHEDLCLLAEA
mmetsp:Transcript_4499/g.14428  ORF Transcript_4499/g.14428 Transcript_4499/m.14428 type:complete len:593 (-) Transcript_4499:147-1925(-)